MIGPGDEVAGAGGPSRLRASQGGREQVIDALKDAFVHGRLDRAEFDLRVSKVLAGYAELDALTADIPARLPRAQSPESARQSHNKKEMQRGTAAGAGAGMVFTAAMVMAFGGSPVVGLVAVPLVGFFLAVLLAGLLTLLSWALERGPRSQPSRGGPPSADGKTPGRSAPAGQAGAFRQVRHDRRHQAEAAPRRLRRPRPRGYFRLLGGAAADTAPAAAALGGERSPRVPRPLLT